MDRFVLKSSYSPSGDQPKAINELVRGLDEGKKDQVLLGVTGSGKTFTIANVIERTQKPTLVIAHNKTLAAQLTQEFRQFFPDAAVGYFVSYYDYYQPEAYLPNTDTYIEKEATVNNEIDKLRNAATQAILSRDDVIIVSSVSCIYGLGSPEFYAKSTLRLCVNQNVSRQEIMQKLMDLRYVRNDSELVRGSFRPRGENLEIMPSSEEIIYKIIFDYDKIIAIEILHNINRNIISSPKELKIFPAKHYLVPESIQKKALAEIREDLEKRVREFEKNGKIIEAERISRKTNYDLEMIEEVGYCNGIENYSRYFDGREPGDPPFSLLSYFNTKWGNDYLTVIDESHVTIPQIGGMYFGDKSRKDSLINFGFRLPSAIDNRPLKFEEFEKMMAKTIYVSATPSKYELKKSGGDVVEQIVRPTGLVDPSIDIRRTEGQIEDLIKEIENNIDNYERVLVTTLTKKMSEDLTSYMKEKQIKVRYLHSEVETLERIEIITQLRKGDFDVLVGVNLLREGLDMPEVSLVAILDADKEGFLRSETSLIQTIGRSARNVNGRVILYADIITDSMQRAINETDRRRKIQLKYNQANNITPATIQKEIRSILSDIKPSKIDEVEKAMSEKDLQLLIKEKEAQMKQAAKELFFEEAAILRDQLVSLKKASKFFNKIR